MTSFDMAMPTGDDLECFNRIELMSVGGLPRVRFDAYVTAHDRIMATIGALMRYRLADAVRTARLL